MGKQERKTGKTNLIEMRRAKVLDLHSKGFTKRTIAKALKVGKSTVHDDISAIRKEATERLVDFIQSLPYEWTKAVVSFDHLLKVANGILDDKTVEVDQKISAIKTASDLRKAICFVRVA